MDIYDVARPVPTPGTQWTVDSLIPAEPWMRDGACLTTDPDAFFPEAPASRARRQEQAAKRVCGSCTVTRDCLLYALENREEHGIWGGTNEKERRAIHRLRAQS